MSQSWRKGADGGPRKWDYTGKYLSEASDNKLNDLQHPVDTDSELCLNVKTCTSDSPVMISHREKMSETKLWNQIVGVQSHSITESLQLLRQGSFHSEF